MNVWEKLHGASRRRKDRALLAAMEREIANEEKLRANPAYQADVAKMKRWTREVIDAEERKMTAAQADMMPVHQISEEQRRRIAAAFGRPA